MKHTLSTLLLSAAALAAAGCAQAPALSSRGSSAGPAGAVVTQVGYGRSAKFVTCADVDCGRPTPKTLAESGDSQAPVRVAQEPVAADHVHDGKPQQPEPPTAAAAAQPEATASASAPTAALVAAPTPAPEPQPAPQPAPREEEVVAPRIAAKPAAGNAEFLQAESSSGRQRVFIAFPSGSARLTKDAKAKLAELAPQVLNAQRVVIKGRTDERGSADSNDRLALRRAMAVYDYLRHSARATNTPFQLLAKGACCYIARNITEDGRAANRRAEIDFVTPMQASVRPAQPSPGKGKPS